MPKYSGNLLSVNLDFLNEEPDEFIHTGFNGQILQVGYIREFWECYPCGNATRSLPLKCEKCHCISCFVFRRLRGRLRS